MLTWRSLGTFCVQSDFKSARPRAALRLSGLLLKHSHAEATLTKLDSSLGAPRIRRVSESSPRSPRLRARRRWRVPLAAPRLPRNTRLSRSEEPPRDHHDPHPVPGVDAAAASRNRTDTLERSTPAQPRRPPTQPHRPRRPHHPRRAREVEQAPAHRREHASGNEHPSPAARRGARERSERTPAMSALPARAVMLGRTYPRFRGSAQMSNLA